MITVAQIEGAIIGRTRGYLAKARLTVAATGTDPTLAGPIARAMRDAGIAPVDPFQPADADLNGIDGEALDEIIDRAELRTLEDIFGNLTSVSVNIGNLQVYKSDLIRALTERIAQVEARVAKTWGLSRGSLNAASIDLNFQQEEC